MLFKLVKYSDMSQDQKNDFKEYCKEQSNSDDSASSNLWGNESHHLTFILNHTSRFSSNNGEFYIAFCDNEIAACSGIYKSEFNSHVALAGTRTWTTKKFRNLKLSREYLLPNQKQWAIDRNFKQIAICFNDYNKNLTRTIFRSRLGEAPLLRTSKHLFYSNINEIPFPVNIQDTKQWVVYEKIDSNWEFDWSKIKCF